MATADCYVWSLRKAWFGAKKTFKITHPIIGDTIIVIILVTFITKAIFVMIFLPRVWKIRTVIL